MPAETAEDGDDEREAMRETDVVKERFLTSHFPRASMTRFLLVALLTIDNKA